MSAVHQYADFGPCIVETDIDAAVVKLLLRWFPTHLAQLEVERGFNPGFLSRPKPESFANTLDEDEFLDHRLPAVIVTTAQTVGAPEKDGDGFYYAAWTCIVSAVVRGRTPPETRSFAALYGGAVRRIMASMDALDGNIAGESRWVAGNVAPVRDSSRRGRYLAASINQFSVYVDRIFQQGTGPSLPLPPESPYPPPDPDSPATPYDPLAEVRDVYVDVTATPIKEST